MTLCRVPAPRAAILILLTFAAALLAGCSVPDPDGSGAQIANPGGSVTATTAGLDRSGENACDDFARYIRDGAPRDKRAEVVETVVALARTSSVSRLGETAQLLENVGATGTDGAWQIAADAFAQACFDAGWKG